MSIVTLDGNILFIMKDYERDPFDPDPEWKDWTLTLITVRGIINARDGTTTGRVALMEYEVLDSRFSEVNVGETNIDGVPLDHDTHLWHASDEFRRYSCLDRGTEVAIGAKFLVAMYYRDSQDGMKRAAVTAQWPAEDYEYQHLQGHLAV